MDAILPASARKWLYAVTAGVNTVAVALLPLLVSFGVVPATIADQILQVIGAVLAVFAGFVAFKNVPAPVAPVDSAE